VSFDARQRCETRGHPRAGEKVGDRLLLAILIATYEDEVSGAVVPIAKPEGDDIHLDVRAGETIALVGLGGLASRRCEHLSGGERRRLDVALALTGQTSVVGLDRSALYETEPGVARQAQYSSTAPEARTRGT